LENQAMLILGLMEAEPLVLCFWVLLSLALPLQSSGDK
jgi:hypothetical protein